jgi:cytochrome P450
VIPAIAGIQNNLVTSRVKFQWASQGWIPAFAGMTMVSGARRGCLPRHVMRNSRPDEAAQDVGSMNEETTVLAPTYDADIFTPDALRAPFDHYRAMRDLAPVVRLANPDVYALPRFDDTRDALRASNVLISGQGVGFNDAFNKPGQPNVLQSDGEQHRRMKAWILRPLLPAQLKQHRDMLKDLISKQIASLVDRGPFDAMEGIARCLPLSAISFLVGLPDEGRASMLKWAAATFNALGPPHDDFVHDVALLRDAFAYLANTSRENVREGSWARALFDAAGAGKLSEAEARGALSAYVLPSLDTTILAKGSLLYDLATTPDVWRRLREDRSLVEKAVIEGVRHRSVLRWFSRVATADYRVEDFVIPEGSRVMLMYASANRDDRHYPDPDRFDIDRDARDQLSWGVGEHTCAGASLAKLEMEVMLEALLDHCETIEAGEPEIGANRGLYGFAKLPFELKSKKA